MKKLVGWLGMLLMACLAIRLAALLLEPALPVLVVLFFFATVTLWLFGSKGGGPGGYR